MSKPKCNLFISTKDLTNLKLTDYAKCDHSFPDVTGNIQEEMLCKLAVLEGMFNILGYKTKVHIDATANQYNQDYEWEKDEIRYDIKNVKDFNELIELLRREDIISEKARTFLLDPNRAFRNTPIPINNVATMYWTWLTTIFINKDIAERDGVEAARYKATKDPSDWENAFVTENIFELTTDVLSVIYLDFYSKDILADANHNILKLAEKLQICFRKHLGKFFYKHRITEDNLIKYIAECYYKNLEDLDDFIREVLNGIFLRIRCYHNGIVLIQEYDMCYYKYEVFGDELKPSEDNWFKIRNVNTMFVLDPWIKCIVAYVRDHDLIDYQYGYTVYINEDAEFDFKELIENINEHPNVGLEAEANNTVIISKPILPDNVSDSKQDTLINTGNVFTMEDLAWLLNKQNELNIETAGDGWWNGVAKNGKPIDYVLAMKMEAAELMDSLDWKHWKQEDKEVDKYNILIELVDILHFALSNYLMKGFFPGRTKDALKVSNAVENVEHDPVWEDECKHFTEHTMYELIKQAVHDLFVLDYQYDSFTAVIRIIKTVLANGFNMDLKDFTNLYKYKVALNKFRIQNGYQDGTYVKIHKVYNGDLEVKVEDNAWIIGLLNQTDIDLKHELTEDDILAIYKEIYLTLKDNNKDNVYVNKILGHTDQYGVGKLAVHHALHSLGLVKGDGENEMN